MPDQSHSPLMQEIIKAIKPFQRRLVEGERIALQVTEACGCSTDVAVGQGVDKSVKCHLCGGKGWIIDATTFRSTRKEG